VKLDLDIKRIGGKEPAFTAEQPNLFVCMGDEYTGQTGFDKVSVSINALRRI
jgi:hypothetical protein